MLLFQPPVVYKEPEWDPNHQSHHYCRLDNTSPRHASTSTSASGCSIPRLQGCSGVTLLMSSKRTADFHSQVKSSLKTCLPRAPLTFTRKSLHLSRRAGNCTIEFHSQVNSSLRRASKCTVDLHKSPPRTCYPSARLISSRNSAHR